MGLDSYDIWSFCFTKEGEDQWFYSQGNLSDRTTLTTAMVSTGMRG